jgi:hypothetical protein
MTTMAQRYKFDLVVAKLKTAGWRVYIGPDAVHRMLGIDEWILRRKDDRLDYLFVCESGEWKRWRFVREPFGDYTIVFENKGSGKDLQSLVSSQG